MTTRAFAMAPVEIHPGELWEIGPQFPYPATVGTVIDILPGPVIRVATNQGIRLCLTYEFMRRLIPRQATEHTTKED